MFDENKSSPALTPTKKTRQKTRQLTGMDSRDKLLDSAEFLFAEHGFDGCTLRHIADHAGVNQGMIHYFFRTKENIFREAYFRRGSVITARRLALLEREEYSSGGQPVPLERLIEIFLEPVYEMALGGDGGRSFLRMQARLQLDGSPYGKEIRQTLYDESSRRFVAALKRSMPRVSWEEVCWRFTFLLGAYQYVLADTGRLEAISMGQLNGSDLQQAMRYLVPFLVAGMNRPSS